MEHRGVLFCVERRAVDQVHAYIALDRCANRVASSPAQIISNNQRVLALLAVVIRDR